jgi:hypothetical protein
MHCARGSNGTMRDRDSLDAEVKEHVHGQVFYIFYFREPDVRVRIVNLGIPNRRLSTVVAAIRNNRRGHYSSAVEPTFFQTFRLQFSIDIPVRLQLDSVRETITVFAFDAAATSRVHCVRDR